MMMRDVREVEGRGREESCSEMLLKYMLCTAMYNSLGVCTVCFIVYYFFPSFSLFFYYLDDIHYSHHASQHPLAGIRLRP